MNLGDYRDLPQAVLDQLSVKPPIDQADFVCAICQQPQRASRYWFRPKEKPMAPICNSCENPRYYSGYGMRSGRKKVSGGTFMDSRMANRLWQIADALSGESHQMKWSEKHGRS